MPYPIQILLSTWNGEAFLGELLDSLLAQANTDWEILARDDASTDGTVKILEHFRGANPGRISLHEDGQRLGPALSFSALLESSTAPYVMLCDQDDVWRPDKIEVTLQAIKGLEEQHRVDTPLLVHTDLEVVDARLNRLSHSLRHYQHLDPTTAEQLNRQLVMNAVTGCTVMANRALVELAGPVPPEAVMHDWWLALVAAAFGHTAWVESPTIQYRQHGANDTGGKHFSPAYILSKVATFWQTGELEDTIREAQAQASAFLNRFQGRLSPQQQEVVQAYAGLKEKGWLGRRASIIRHGLWKTGMIRNLGFLLRI
ncbi:MAG: glycosyltransferase family 2 protein [Planctomycetota bacterium]|jgi:glycosyltransferase involved in cell wall biosynthesis